MGNDVTARLRAKVARRPDIVVSTGGTHEDNAGFAHQVDHIVSRKHGGSSALDNLAYACVLCNRYKGSDVASVDPQSGEPVRLFHPRRDKWSDHFRVESDLIDGLTEPGRATVRLLRWNAQERVAERRLIGS